MYLWSKLNGANLGTGGAATDMIPIPFLMLVTPDNSGFLGKVFPGVRGAGEAFSLGISAYFALVCLGGDFFFFFCDV
jgi:hypothetical protein